MNGLEFLLMADRSTNPADSSGSEAKRITAAETFEDVISNEGRVLADFYASWCGPCQMMTSTIDELATESDGRVVKVDIEALPQLAARYDVRSIPAFLVFDNGEVTERLVGMQEKETLAQTLL